MSDQSSSGAGSSSSNKSMVFMSPPGDGWVTDLSGTHRDLFDRFGNPSGREVWTGNSVQKVYGSGMPKPTAPITQASAPSSATSTDLGLEALNNAMKQADYKLGEKVNITDTAGNKVSGRITLNPVAKQYEVISDNGAPVVKFSPQVSSTFAQDRGTDIDILVSSAKNANPVSSNQPGAHQTLPGSMTPQPSNNPPAGLTGPVTAAGGTSTGAHSLYDYLKGATREAPLETPSGTTQVYRNNIGGQSYTIVSTVDKTGNVGWSVMDSNRHPVQFSQPSAPASTPGISQSQIAEAMAGAGSGAVPVSPLSPSQADHKVTNTNASSSKEDLPSGFTGPAVAISGTESLTPANSPGAMSRIKSIFTRGKSDESVQTQPEFLPAGPTPGGIMSAPAISTVAGSGNIPNLPKVTDSNNQQAGSIVKPTVATSGMTEDQRLNVGAALSGIGTFSHEPSSPHKNDSFNATTGMTENQQLSVGSALGGGSVISGSGSSQPVNVTPPSHDNWAQDEPKHQTGAVSAASVMSNEQRENIAAVMSGAGSVARNHEDSKPKSAATAMTEEQRNNVGSALSGIGGVNPPKPQNASQALNDTQRANLASILSGNHSSSAVMSNPQPSSGGVASTQKDAAVPAGVIVDPGQNNPQKSPAQVGEDLTNYLNQQVKDNPNIADVF